MEGLLQPLIQVLQLLLQPPDVGPDARSHGPVGTAQAVLLCHQHFHHLGTPRRQGMEFLGVGVRQWAHLRTDCLGEMRQDLGVQDAGLGLVSLSNYGQ